MRHRTGKLIIASCMSIAWQATADLGQALAQSEGQAPETPALSAATFIERARAGHAFEIESSRLALEKATQPALKTFARSMIDDHTRADQRLTKLTKEMGRPVTKAAMEPHQRRNTEALTAATGAAFDRLYASLQLEAHQTAVQLYQTYSETGTDAQLRKYALETLPILQGHLKQIEAMNQ